MDDVLKEQTAQAIVDQRTAIPKHYDYVKHMKADGDEEQDFHWPDDWGKWSFSYDCVEVVEYDAYPSSVQNKLNSLQSCNAFVLERDHLLFFHQLWLC